MNEPTSVRLDKWLWAVRVYKTRSLAANACRHGQVTIDGQPVKPSRDARIGEVFAAKTDIIVRTLKVLKLLEHRVGPQVVKEFAEDLTPDSEYEKLREPKLQPMFYRPKGAGRPTKKERRALDRFL